MTRTTKTTKPANNAAGFVSDYPQVDAADVFNAYNTLAYFFVQPVTWSDGSTHNDLAKTQKAVLEGICYSLNNQLQGNNNGFEGVLDRHAKQVADIKAHLTEFNGTEIWQRQLLTKTQAADRTEQQKLHLESALHQAMRCYEKFVGEPYKPRTVAKKETAVISQDVHAVARKYGVDLNTPNNMGTGGEQLSSKGQ